MLAKWMERDVRCTSHVLEALVNELNRHGAFADGRGDALHGAGPHIPGREDTWPAGLQQKRLPRGSPVWGACQIRPGADEPLRIPLNFRGEPIGSRVGADKTENSRGFYDPFHPGLAVADIHRVEVAITAHLADSGAGEQFDVGGLLDPPHQVAGHVLVQVISPDQKQHMAGVSGEKRPPPGRRNCRRRQPRPGNPGTVGPRRRWRRSKLPSLRIVRNPPPPAGGSRPRWRSAGTWPSPSRLRPGAQSCRRWRRLIYSPVWEQKGGRRICWPGGWRGRPVHCPSSRWGSQDSFRFAYWRRLVLQARCARVRRSSALRRRHTLRPQGPPDRRPRPPGRTPGPRVADGYRRRRPVAGWR